MRSRGFAWLAIGMVALVPGVVVGQSIPTKYLPPDTEVVITINVQQMLNSEVAKGNQALVNQGKSLLQDKLQESGADKYLAKAGIDLFHDVHTVTVAGPGTNDKSKAVVIIEGKFNPQKLLASAEEASKDTGAITVSKADGATVYEIPQPDGKTAYVRPLGTDVLLAASSKETLSATATQAQAGQTPTLSKGFKTLLQTTNDKQSISIAVTGPAFARMLENAPGANDAAAAYLKGMDGLSLAVTLSKDVKFQIGVNATGKEAAEQFSKFGNGAILWGRGMLAQKAKEDVKFAPIVEVLETLQIVTQGTNLVLRGEISYENLGKLLKNLPQK
jgi:hypothetical protein